MRPSRTFLTACLLLAFSASPALAHRVSLFAYANGDAIYTESRFNKSTPVHHGDILVTDAATGAELLRGTTDDKGLFNFPIPQKARDGRLDLIIAVQAGEGHRGEWRLPASDYLGATATPKNDSSVPTSVATSDDSGKTGPTETAGAAMPEGVTPDALETLVARAVTRSVDHALDQRLRPLTREIAALRSDDPSFSDVVGGLGYLIGLAGIVAYMRSRRV